jgi:hypothetical protein
VFAKLTGACSRCLSSLLSGVLLLLLLLHAMWHHMCRLAAELPCLYGDASCYSPVLQWHSSINMLVLSITQWDTSGSSDCVRVSWLTCSVGNLASCAAASRSVWGSIFTSLCGVQAFSVDDGAVQ